MMLAVDYEVLGLTRTASLREVREAYKEQALQHHPDRPACNADRFKKAQRAYQNICASLTNPEAAMAASMMSAGSSSSFAASHSGRYTAEAFGSQAAPHPATSAATSNTGARRQSFMRPTTSSRNAEGPKIPMREKPSNMSAQKAPTCRPAAAASSSTSPAIGVPPPLISKVAKPRRVSLPDLSDVVLDTSERAFRVAKAAHLHADVLVRRRTDGMHGIIAGILPQNGALMWFKDNATFAALAPGSPSQYVPMSAAYAQHCTVQPPSGSRPTTPTPPHSLGGSIHSATAGSTVYADPLADVRPSVIDEAALRERLGRARGATAPAQSCQAASIFSRCIDAHDGKAPQRGVPSPLPFSETLHNGPPRVGGDLRPSTAVPPPSGSIHDLMCQESRGREQIVSRYHLYLSEAKYIAHLRFTHYNGTNVQFLH